jgi:gamma-glutamylcyclotransferase (GGCT)/AIG2-like uncharacterized protein YtfP
MLYFGYGSNLDEIDLARYCSERDCVAMRLARVGPAFLPDRRLACTHRSTTRDGGVLDIPPARGNAVSGILFRVLPDGGIATLDRKEGEGHVYERFETVALTDDGAEEPVFAYQVAPEHREPFVPPAPPYLNVVRRGYASHGLETEPLEAAVAGKSPASPIAGVFVYGTLRRGEERHRALARHVAAGGVAASTTGTLLDLGAYPGLVVDGTPRVVSGEFYVAPDADALLTELDAIETFHGFGAPGSLYRRAIVRVRRALAGSTLAWTYVYAGSRTGSGVIASGDWLDRQRS